MRFTTENHQGSTFLIYELDDIDHLDEMDKGMLEHAAPPGLAATRFSQMNATGYVWYDITAKVSAARLFHDAVSRRTLIGVFSGIVNTMLNVDRYLLNPDKILLDMEYIYVDVATAEPVLLYVPLENYESHNLDLRTFFKNIIFNVRPVVTEDSSHITRIMSFLNQGISQQLSLPAFKQLLDGLSTSQYAAPYTEPNVATQVEMHPQDNVREQKPHHVQQSTPAQNAKKPAPTVQQKAHNPKWDDLNEHFGPSANEKEISLWYLLCHYSKENKALYDAQKERKKNKGNVGKSAPKPTPEKRKGSDYGFARPGDEPSQVNRPADVTPVRGGEEQRQNSDYHKPKPSYGEGFTVGETSILGMKTNETTELSRTNIRMEKPRPYLIRISNGEKIPVDRDVFHIGRERSRVNYCVSDNTAVSRNHADIEARGDGYVLVDTNSRHGTYVNGGRIDSGVDVMLSHGSRICLADEEFEFKLY